LVSSTTGDCTLRDLCAGDKAKVAKLIKQVVELGKEVRQLKGHEPQVQRDVQQQDQQREQQQRQEDKVRTWDGHTSPGLR
jgi:FtsZ-binding cell division protein ZapB